MSHIKLPNDFPAQLEHLTVTCNMPLKRQDYDPEVIKQASPFAKLRTLMLAISRRTIHETTALVLADWVLWAVECMKEGGGWDLFEELRLLGDEEGEDAVTIIQRDDAVRWCKNEPVSVMYIVLCLSEWLMY